jgi:hypothetical protein
VFLHVKLCIQQSKGCLQKSHRYPSTLKFTFTFPGYVKQHTFPAIKAVNQNMFYRKEVDMDDDIWRSKEREEIDLSLENSSLETEIKLKGGIFSSKTDDIDPLLENAFLKNVLAYEEAAEDPQIPMVSVFPENYKFPPAESISEAELFEKLEDISRVLSDHGIELGFSNDLPDKVLYKYLVEECIPKEMIDSSVTAGFTWVLDGCSGGCEECFQREYCSNAQEL